MQETGNSGDGDQERERTFYHMFFFGYLLKKKSCHVHALTIRIIKYLENLKYMNSHPFKRQFPNV